MKFKFHGSAYKYEHMIMTDKTFYCDAKSKEQAVNHFKQQVREKMGYINSVPIDLSGSLVIMYPLGQREIYYLTKNKLEADNIYPIPFQKLPDNKVRLDNIAADFAGKSVVSIEEAKEINFELTAAFAPNTIKFILVCHGEQFDVSEDIQDYSKQNYILFNGDKYLYDSAEETYWKNGQKFDDRIDLR